MIIIDFYKEVTKAASSADVELTEVSEKDLNKMSGVIKSLEDDDYNASLFPSWFYEHYMDSTEMLPTLSLMLSNHVVEVFKKEHKDISHDDNVELENKKIANLNRDIMKVILKKDNLEDGIKDMIFEALDEVRHGRPTPVMTILKLRQRFPIEFSHNVSFHQRANKTGMQIIKELKDFKTQYPAKSKMANTLLIKYSKREIFLSAFEREAHRLMNYDMAK